VKSNSTKYSTALFIIVALAFIFVGCSTDTSVAPIQQTANGLQVQSTDGPVTMLQMNPDALAKGEGFNFSTQVDIDADQGGQLVVGNPTRGYSKLIFPPNALSEDMTISLEFWIDDFFEGLFEPHGTYFNEPVRVELSYKNADLTGVNENGLQIYYYNETIGLWEHIGGEVDTANKIVVCYLEHFSRYAIIKT
jgi:hypothetical protein